MIVDLAVEQGGNVEGAKLGEVVETANGVKILGIPNLPGRIAADASALYARNLFAFAGLLLDKEGAFAPDYEDEILKAALVTQGGAIVHPAAQGELRARWKPSIPPSSAWPSSCWRSSSATTWSGASRRPCTRR